MSGYCASELICLEMACMTAGLFPSGLDSARYWNDCDEYDIIGWLDAPEMISAGGWHRGDDFIGLYFGPQTLLREGLAA